MDWWYRFLIFYAILIAVLCALYANRGSIMDQVHRFWAQQYGVGLGNLLCGYYFHMYNGGRDWTWRFVNPRDRETIGKCLPTNRHDEASPVRRSRNVKLGDNHYASAWETIDEMWEPLQPVIQADAQRFLDACPLVMGKSVPQIVIHYRLADILESRPTAYTLKYYSYYRDALSMYAGDETEVMLMSNFTHRTRDTSLSRAYFDDLADYLTTQLNFRVTKRCNGSLLDDYCACIRTPLLITSGGSFGFFAGMSADPQQQTFVYPRDTDHALSYEYRQNMHALTGYELLHSDVKDYHETADVFRLLRSRN